MAARHRTLQKMHRSDLDAFEIILIDLANTYAAITSGDGREVIVSIGQFNRLRKARELLIEMKERFNGKAT